MGRLGIFLLGTAVGVVGTGLAAWAHDAFCGGSSRSASGCDSDDEAESLRSRHEELSEKIEDIKSQREALDEEIQELMTQRDEIMRDLDAASTADAQTASSEASSDDPADFSETSDDDPADFDEALAGARA